MVKQALFNYNICDWTYSLFYSFSDHVFLDHLEIDFGGVLFAGQACTTVIDINKIVDILRINNLIDFYFNFKRHLTFLPLWLNLIIFILLIMVLLLLNLVFADS